MGLKSEHNEQKQRVMADTSVYARMGERGEAISQSGYRRSFIRGIIGNTLSLGILLAVTLISPHLVLPTLTALVIQWGTFAFHGLPFASEKYFDLSGSLTHFAVVLTALGTCPGGASLQQVCFGLLSTVWLVRLGTFLYLRILRDGRDERFEELKMVPVRFLSVWTIQALWVVLVQMPVILISSEADSLPLACLLVNMLWLGGWLGAFLVEAIADVQKYEFRCDPRNRDRFITHGLWRYSRHPNYFGEILMWTAAAGAASVFGVYTARPSLHFAWLSPAFTALLLLKVSGVPLVSKAGKKKWGDDPAWQHYMKHTSMLLPWRPAQAPVSKAVY